MTEVAGMPEPQGFDIVDLVAASRLPNSRLCDTINEQMASIGLPMGLAKGMVAAGVTP